MRRSISTETPAGVVEATASELDEARRWATAKFAGESEQAPVHGHLMAYLKSGRLQKNRVGTTGYSSYATGSSPLNIAGTIYSRGLHCPSEGRVVVHLPGPGKSLETVAGVDSNQRTGFPSNAGRGAAIATVVVGDTELYRSPVLREGMSGIRVAVELARATELSLGLADAGGGTVQRVDFNQLDWAEARVTLADGRTVWLDELPVGPLRGAYSVEPPYSFRYDGRYSSEVLAASRREYATRNVGVTTVEHAIRHVHPVTGLEVRCVGVEYRDFPVVEWTVWLRNTGDRITPLLEDILGIDALFERDGEGEFVLHHHQGSSHSMVEIGTQDYRPFETLLERGTEKKVGSRDGLPAAGDFPFFNVARGGDGVIVAVGWPGQWAGRFSRDAERSLRIEAGQQLSRFKLLPGEEVRAPRIVMLFWKGDWIRGQNLWRRWMMAHNMPKPGGKLPPPQVAASSSAYYIEMAEADEENQKLFIDRFAEEGLDIDYWWIDAGWHVFKSYWLDIGTWEPDPKRFPRGLRPISDHLHTRGQKMILWFVPEYATVGTRVDELPAEWLLEGDTERFKMVNLGIPEAREWLTEHVDRQIKEQGVDLYRHDGNPPLGHWRRHETADRQGITENRYVRGYLAYWDQLRARNPTILTDICAGGGGRNDVEGLRRAVPLWRSDYAFETTGMQNLTYGMALWVPYFGTGVIQLDSYACRSQMAPALTCSWDVRNPDLDYGFLRRFLSQWRQVAENYYGDFYPLTPFRPEDDVWMAWQFNRPETGEGMVQAFRRRQSRCESMRFALQGLDGSATYEVNDMDSSNPIESTGTQLMDDGLLVALHKQPDSALIAYRRKLS